MTNIFGKLLASTKENTNEAIGFYGLGSKSCFSYADYFNLITRIAGIEYQYIIHKGEVKIRIDLITTIPTTEKNGTEVKIYIKDVGYYNTDVNTFKNEVSKQLCYFNGVYFVNCNVDNDFEIVKGKTFFYKNKQRYSEELHLVLGSVSYPIDWSTIKRSRINLPFGLRFEIGEFMVTPNRESVSYSLETINLINTRIDEFLKEIEEIYLKQSLSTDSLEEYIKKKDLDRSIELAGNTIYLRYNSGHNLHNLPKISFTPFSKFKFIPSEILFEYNWNKRDKINSNSTLSKRKDYQYRNLNKYDIYIGKESFTNLDKKKLSYIADVHNGYILRRKNITLKGYKEELKLSNYHKSEWREIISTYQKEVEKYVLSKVKIYNDIAVDPQWLEDRKKSRNTNLIDRNSEILYYEVSNTVYKVQTKFSNLESYNLIIYSDDKDKLVNLYNSLLLGYSEYHLSEKNLHNYRRNIFSFRNKKVGFNIPIFKLIKTAKVYHKTLSQLPNTISYESFMENQFKVIGKIATRIKLKDLRKKNFIDERGWLSKVNSEINNDLIKIENYLNSNTYYDIRYSHEITKAFEKELLELADKHNLYDSDIIDTIKKLEKYFEGLELLKCLSNVEDKEIPLIVEYFKFKKKKVNLEWYQTPSNYEKELLEETKEKVNYLNTINI